MGANGAVTPTQGGILVLDFGSQFAQLIARRVRELNVHSELIAFDTPLSEIVARNPAGIILSGSPSSVYDVDGPKPDPALWGERPADLGHLLRRAADGAAARR